MMGGFGVLRVEWLFLFTCLFKMAASFPLCIDMAAPSPASSNLSFCSNTQYSTKGCCGLSDDNSISKTFKAMNITDAACANAVKQILCAQCDAYSADLFGYQSQSPRDVPYLCNTDSSSNLTTTTGKGYCHSVWAACQNVSIQNSPFNAGLKGFPGSPAPSASLSELSAQLAVQQKDNLGSLWASETDFCTDLGPSSAAGNFCFSGVPFVPPPASNFTPPQGICLEKISEDAYLNMVPYPDGSNRVVVNDQAGSAWIATIPEPGQPLILNESAPFLDISDRVTNQNELGFLGFAFHPNFANNGRFFVSYNCDQQKWADCGGRCACNNQTNCNPSELRSGQLGGDGGTDPCRYSSIVAEYTVNSTSSSPLDAVIANPVEVRRIFTMALPYTTHHAGGLLFGPLDGYLYLMLGDGGNSGDPFNFAQNKKSLLGKILRLDIDNLPSKSQISNLGLWGEYTIPDTNPFVKDSNAADEVWAYGLRNPWRCSFDSQHPTYMYCGDVGQETEEEVDLISRGGNYGWRVYEGNIPYVPQLSPGGNTSASSIQPIFPIITYLHSAVNPQQGYAAVTGGYISYSREDACLYGKYLYADLFGTIMVAQELPQFSGNYKSADVSYHCSSNSPLNCTFVGNSTVPTFPDIVSFGEDNNGNMFVLAGNGLYRVTSPDQCNIVCHDVLPPLAATPPSVTPVPSPTPPKESPAPSPSQSSPSSAQEANSKVWLLSSALLIVSMVVVFQQV